MIIIDAFDCNSIIGLDCFVEVDINFVSGGEGGGGGMTINEICKVYTLYIFDKLY